jgi:putative drug exporter of the RND superfamily
MRLNLAARIGVWSAHHHRTAIIGWLLFVVLATAVGGASGMVEMSESEQGTGDSARAQKVLDDTDLDRPAGELVLVSSKTADGWKDAARELAAAIEKTSEAQKIEPPLASKDGREALIRFQIKGDSKTAADRVQPVLDAVRDTRKAQQGVEVHQFGQASAEKRLGDLLS